MVSVKGSMRQNRYDSQLDQVNIDFMVVLELLTPMTSPRASVASREHGKWQGTPQQRCRLSSNSVARCSRESKHVMIKQAALWSEKSTD